MPTDESAVQRELDLIAGWGFSPVRRGDSVLVPRGEAVACLHRLLELELVDLWGLDAFTLHEDGTLTPHPDSSPDYAESSPPPAEIEAVILDAPDEVTHFEFVVGLTEPWEE